MLKTGLYFIFVLGLAFTANAIADESLSLRQAGDQKNSMVWPMLPGESLQDLATKFYPKSKPHQQAFIIETQRLNVSSLPSLNVTERFTAPTNLVVPTINSLLVRNKSIRKTKKQETLKLSYNIKSTVEQVPENLYKEYYDLVFRNEFLKKELAKLNRKLKSLLNTLGELRLVFENTLKASVANNAQLKTQPKKLKNLQKDISNQPTAEKTSIDLTKSELYKADAPNSNSSKFDLFTKSKNTILGFFNQTNKWLWLSLLALALLIVLVIYVFKKSKQNKSQISTAFRNSNETLTSFNLASNGSKQELESSSFDTTSELDTIVEDREERSMLNKAKAFVRNNQINEAISHLKWAVRSKPEVDISIWLYLLSLLKANNEKKQFERLSLELNKTFNVMTPVWKVHAEAQIVIPQNLEEFPHVIQRLTQEWPADTARDYLKSLISNNRNGERVGFSQAVVEEVLLLIDVVEMRANF